MYGEGKKERIMRGSGGDGSGWKVGEVAGAVGGRGGEGMHVGTRGIGGGVCVWRCWGKEGGGTVVARDQPASRSKEARKKCWDFFVSSVWL